MKKLLIISLIVSSLYSCLNMNEPKDQARYIENYKLFDKEMVSHFPKILPNSFVGLTFSNPNYLNDYHNYADFQIITRISSNSKYENLKRKLIKEAQIIKKSTDTCLISVTSKENRKIMNCNAFFPVPEYLISEFISENERKKLLNSEIAILDYKSGKYLDINKLIEKENLPEKWKNGYSKGYAFDNIKQTITYWLIIW